jgi:acetate CoA/acetoacetate CoA-transferase alpha subunit
MRRDLSFVQPHERAQRKHHEDSDPGRRSGAPHPDGASLMIGGFMGVGAPHRLIDALVARGCKNLTVIGNDTARPGIGVAKLISSGQVARVITSHIGLNPETQKKMLAGEIDVELVPQGTLAERIRAAGYGLGGVLVKTGIGTLAARAGRPWRSMARRGCSNARCGRTSPSSTPTRPTTPATSAYQLTATNFNPVMAMAADTVICEAREILPIGMIAPDDVGTPGVLVDCLIGVAAA